jgi:aminopeptidase
MPNSITDRLCRLLVNHSTAVRPGERVSVVGPAACEPMLAALDRHILSVGGLPHRDRPVEDSDVFLEIVTPSGQTPQISPPWDLIFKRHEAGLIRWAVAACSGPESAAALRMSPEIYDRMLFTACLLDHSDPAAAWCDMTAGQARLISALERFHDLRLVTPAGTDLRVSIAGRTWINGDARHNLPDGEVYTGPIEDATNGVIYLDFPARHSGQVVRHARLRLHAGRVVDATATEGEAFLLHKLAQDAGARILGELGFGCNERLSAPVGHPMFDEKIAGTFHVALGASFPATGGRNQSSIHWDLVCDLRAGGRIEADGCVINENGQWLV